MKKILILILIKDTMWVYIGLLFVTMCGLIVAAVEMWHLLHLNEDVKKSKTKTALCWTGFGVCVALAIVCAGMMIKTLGTSTYDSKAELLHYMKETQGMLGSAPTAPNQEDEALLQEEIESLERELNEGKQEAIKRLTEIQETLPSVHQMISIIDAKRKQMIKPGFDPIRSADYQSLMKDRKDWEKTRDELIDEQTKIIQWLKG